MKNLELDSSLNKTSRVEKFLGWFFGVQPDLSPQNLIPTQHQLFQPKCDEFDAGNSFFPDTNKPPTEASANLSLSTGGTE